MSELPAFTSIFDLIKIQKFNVEFELTNVLRS